MRLLSTAVSVLVVFLLPPQGARADECRDVDTTIVTTFFVAGCRSPVGICTKGEVPTGPLAGKTRFDRVLNVFGGDHDVFPKKFLRCSGSQVGPGARRTAVPAAARGPTDVIVNAVT